MLDRADGQDARAPGGVVGIERAGKMDTAFGRGPSPVITPSRTIVSAWAAVWRQDGCGTSDVSAVLAVGAGIVALLNFFFISSISIRGMNERLTIETGISRFLAWLPIGRCEVGHGSAQGTPGA